MFLSVYISVVLCILVVGFVYCDCQYDQFDSVTRNDEFVAASRPYIGVHHNLTLCITEDKADWYRTWIVPGNTLYIQVDVSDSRLWPSIKLRIHDDSGSGIFIFFRIFLFCSFFFFFGLLRVLRQARTLFCVCIHMKVNDIVE
jgi:hypothetical protein